MGDLVGAGVGELVGAEEDELVGTEVGELVGTGVGEPVGWESVKWSARESASRRCSRRGSVAVGLGGSVGPLLWICRGSAVGCVRE